MKRNAKIFLKVSFFIVLALAVILLALIVYCYAVTKDVNLDDNKLVDLDRGVNYYDISGNIISEQSGGLTVTPIYEIPENVRNAFIAVEDKRFYSHKGIDVKRLFAATLSNVKSMSFREGASTISQQLIKNTHLTSQKTIKRKLAEMKLARQLEKRYSKEEILEKYLNTIYFGEGCYGITAASRYYFDKTPAELSLNEGAALAAVIKAPSAYSPLRNPEESEKRKDLVLSKMREQNFISEEEFTKYSGEKIKTNSAKSIPSESYLNLVKAEIGDFLDKNAYTGKKFMVYTNFDPSAQDILENYLHNDIDSDKSAILTDKENRIIAYYSTCGCIERQAGSALKPLAVFAPAIELNTVCAETPVLDERTDFDGYSPSNYGDKYYGYITVREALAKSLNVPAVKILNATGVKRAREIAKKLDIGLTEGDNSLTLALGCTEKGVSLKNLTAAYGIFYNQGYYCAPHAVSKITAGSQTVYTAEPYKNKIIGEDTAFIVGDMLRSAVKSGTAKKLSYLDFPVYAKTGTVGTDKGNTDAYCISYNGKYSLGIWYGNRDNSLMDNSITGGSYPAQTAFGIWKALNLPHAEVQMPESVCSVPLDKITFDEDHILSKAEDIAPKRYVIEGLFKKDNLPAVSSERFRNPVLTSFELSVNSNKISIRLCLTEYYDVMIYKDDGCEKKLIYDSDGSKPVDIVTDLIEEGKTYTYTAIPYYKCGKGIFKGEETELGKVKSYYDGDDWWKDDFI